MFVLAVALPARKNYAQENNSRICLVSVLLKFGCSREGELRGDIFIVTNSAANIKLGLVEVSAIAEKDMSDFLVNRSKAVDTEIAERKKNTTRLRRNSTKLVDSISKLANGPKKKNPAI